MTSVNILDKYPFDSKEITIHGYSFENNTIDFINYEKLATIFILSDNIIYPINFNENIQCISLCSNNTLLNIDFLPKYSIILPNNVSGCFFSCII